MWHLVAAEVARFRGWAIVLAVTHLLVLAFLTRAVDLAQQPLLVYRVFAGIYCVAGLLLGLYQMGVYRRANAWLQLLHRPLPHWQIASALLGSGVLLLGIAIALPMVTICAWQGAMAARIVDSRHWLLPLSACLIAICGYLAGAHCMLANRRIALAALVLVVLLAVNTASGTAALLMQMLVLTWLTCIVLIAFKPDLAAIPQRGLGILLLGLPLQLGIYYLLILLCFGYELLWIMSGSHPNNSVPPRGGHIEALKADARDLLIAGLAVSTNEEAPLWRAQVALSEVFELGREFAALPARGELTNLAPMEFDDTERRVRWVFSHDHMRFEGYRLTDGGRSGELQLGSASARFPDPPLPSGTLAALPAGDSILLGSGTLYQYRSDTAQITPRLQLPGGEVFAAAPRAVGASIAVLSNRALYFCDARAVLETDTLVTPRLRVPLAGAIGNLSRIDLIELVDGYLISLTFAATAHNARVAPRQQLLRVHDDGRIAAVASRELRADYPQWHRYESWWLSPPLHALHGAAVALFARAEPLQVIAPPPVPRDIWALAGVLSLLSLFMALWQARRYSLAPRAQLVWMITCGCVGLPALLSLWLLLPPREQLDAPVPAPA